MTGPSAIAAGFGNLAPEQLCAMVRSFLPQGASTEEKVRAIETGLRSPLGQSLRHAMARWIVDEIVPVESLVPQAYLPWRHPVRDSMMFVVSHLSPSRLAPKLLEQLELPPKTSAEVRLLKLIAKVPGLQKLGQVIARNQHLRPGLRKALAKLENGIRDVTPEAMRAIIQNELAAKIKRYDVKIGRSILSEASVSAVVRFTWMNPETGMRERGVFKVLKPHIPAYFAEDMDYLQGLADYFGERHHTYGFPAHLIPDTFQKVRRLLRHEVNFAREQRTLIEAAKFYNSLPAARVPRLIEPLCTPTITALTEERGVKITNAAARLPEARRSKIAEQLLEALVALPLFAAAPEAVFHGDPHAGNLLYDARHGELTILDWALRERLGREERRHLALLFLTVVLRDPVAIWNEVIALGQSPVRANSARGRMIQGVIENFLRELPPASMPSVADAMRLLERVAMKGIKFPVSLIMLSKVMFTLEGLLIDIAGPQSGMGFALARQIAQHWLANRAAYRSPLTTQDWFVLQCSALLYTGRLWLRWEQQMVDKYLSAKAATAS